MTDYPTREEVYVKQNSTFRSISLIIYYGEHEIVLILGNEYRNSRNRALIIVVVQFIGPPDKPRSFIRGVGKSPVCLGRRRLHLYRG